jgi:adenylosuccinate lyase
MSTNSHDQFEHPLASRYASNEMQRLFSPQTRHRTWRQCWIALARAQHELGLPVSAEQIGALERALDSIDFVAARTYEEQFRHDVMAHIHTFGDAAPEARGIIHLGATSMDIVDNADLLIMRQALQLLEPRIGAAVKALRDFALEYADLPTLGFTHLQPAQLTTVGKRASLWLAEFVEDLRGVRNLHSNLKARGLRGATGTQASFLKLLGDAEKVRLLERRFCELLGFDAAYPVVGQTYSRKVDAAVFASLASFGASTHRYANDIRLLAMLKEIEEPFAKNQIGSSAMAYKRNPMRSERATGLARYLISLAQSPYQTLAAQMFERTLDDSSNKRLVVPEAFMTADALAILLRSISDGLVVYPAMIRARLDAELPFIATEDIMMAAAKSGGDRQELHERIRQHSLAAAAEIKQHGRPNDLIARLQTDEAFAGVDWADVLDPARYVGLSAEQTRAFVTDVVDPLLGESHGDFQNGPEVKI